MPSGSDSATRPFRQERDSLWGVLDSDKCRAQTTLETTASVDSRRRSNVSNAQGAGVAGRFGEQVSSTRSTLSRVGLGTGGVRLKAAVGAMACCARSGRSRSNLRTRPFDPLETFRSGSPDDRACGMAGLDSRKRTTNLGRSQVGRHRWSQVPIGC